MGNCDSSQQEPTTYWDFWIENLTHISCYHIVLQPTNHSNHQHSQYWLLKQPISELARQLEFRVTVSADRQSSIVSLRHKSDDDNNNTYTILFNARLPGQVQSMPSAFQIQQSESQKSVEHGLNLRLQYEAPIHNILEQDASLLAAGLTKTDANRLGCRQCHLPLLAGDGKEGAAVIDRVVRMPSANWDDIADYLICYNGVSCCFFAPFCGWIYIIYFILNEICSNYLELNVMHTDRVSFFLLLDAICTQNSKLPLTFRPPQPTMHKRELLLLTRVPLSCIKMMLGLRFVSWQ